MNQLTTVLRLQQQVMRGEKAALVQTIWRMFKKRQTMGAKWSLLIVSGWQMSHAYLWLSHII